MFDGGGEIQRPELEMYGPLNAHLRDIVVIEKSICGRGQSQ